MLRTFRTSLGLLLALVACNKAAAFSLLGPALSWQTPTVGLDLPGRDVGGPRNIGEEYRLNSGVITYGFDPSFLDYFGNEGVKAVDAAFGVFNSLPPVSRMSSDLSEYQTENIVRVNYRAQALYLVDLKSAMMNLIIEHMGLIGETHVFDLRTRTAVPGAPACTFEYSIINWNFDPVTWEPTHYVNGILYTYSISDSCPAPDQGIAVESTVDRAATPYSAVATFNLLSQNGNGNYFVALSRDDVGGLRYLYRRDNFNNEFLPSDAVITSPNVTSGWSVPSFWATATNVTGVNGTGNGNGTTAAATNTARLFGGVEKINFVKMRANSILGGTYRPATVTYTLPAFDGSTLKLSSVRIQRAITQPDILITAADMGPDTPLGGGALENRTFGVIGAPNNNQTTTTQTNGGFGILGGPGVFRPQMTVTFQKLGPYAYLTGNVNSFYLTEQYSTIAYVWGSFDGSTNAPIVYPSGTSIKEMENAVLNSQLSFDPILGNVPDVFDPAVGVVTNTPTANQGP